MASPSQPFSLSLSLDSSLKPFLSAHHHRRFSLSRSSLQCTTPVSPTQSRTPLSPLSLSKKQQTLSEFLQPHHFPHGTLIIRPMHETEIDAVSRLLSESFIETLFLPPNYVNLLAFLVKNYLQDRSKLLPHAALLVGIYSQTNMADELACTAEISFDERGANAANPTPVPPPDCPYICNMTVKKSLRRKGIGKQLLKTCEDLICRMSEKRDVYLHCRMVDKRPLRIYKKAGYQIVKTDSFLVWLSLQRRKYLMHKTLTCDVVDSKAPNPDVVDSTAPNPDVVDSKAPNPEER